MKTWKRPNVLLLYTDQQRFDTISYRQELAIQTPNLDALAADGAYMEQHFVNNPVCSPSRMSMLTGRYCSSVGVGTNGIGLPRDMVPLNQLLKPYGYHTAQIGKLHFDPHAKRDHRDPTGDYGFDTFILSDEPGCYDDAYTKWVEMMDPEELPKIRTSLPPAAYRYNKPEYSSVPRETHEPYLFEGKREYTHQGFVASETINYIKSRDGRTPFFAIAGFYAPHPPINPCPESVEKVDFSKIAPPVLGEGESFTDRVKDVTPETWVKTRAYYLALVTELDDLVGEIVKTLKEQGLYDDTLIIFTSDHGEFLGDHGRIQKGMPGHDCVIHVPLIIKYSREIPKGRVVEALTEGVDLVPTILDFCGIQIPRYVQGKSMRPLLRGATDEHKDSILVEFFDPYGLRQTTIRTKTHKYYINNRGEEILYDLTDDPGEHINCVGEEKYRDVLSELRRQMIIRIQNAAYPNLEQSAEY